MELQLYFKDTMDQKHIFIRELDDDMIFDELEELVNTFNMLLASCGYEESVMLNVEEESED